LRPAAGVAGRAAGRPPLHATNVIAPAGRRWCGGPLWIPGPVFSRKP
jgi:hypothetical protein